jgi:hypothetical protein
MTPKDMNNNELIEKYGDLVAGAEHLPIGDAKSLTYMEAYKYRDEIISRLKRTEKIKELLYTKYALASMSEIFQDVDSLCA